MLVSSSVQAARAVVDHPRHPAGRGVGRGGHDLDDELGERGTARGQFDRAWGGPGGHRKHRSRRGCRDARTQPRPGSISKADLRPHNAQRETQCGYEHATSKSGVPLPTRRPRTEKIGTSSAFRGVHPSPMPPPPHVNLYIRNCRRRLAAVARARTWHPQAGLGGVCGSSRTRRSDVYSVST